MNINRLLQLLKLLNDTGSSPTAVAALLTAVVPVLAGAIVGIVKAINNSDSKKGRTHSRFTGRKFKDKQDKK